MITGRGTDAYSINGEGDMIVFELEWEDKHTVIFEFSYSPESDLQPLKSIDGANSFDPYSTALFNDNFQYLNAERLSPRIVFPLSHYHVEELHSLGSKGDYTVHFIAVNQRKSICIKQLQHPATTNLTLLSQLDAWMSELAPGVSLDTTVHQDMNAAKLSYKFQIPEGYTEAFKPVNVGFGLTYVLPVITAILASKPGDLLIIENPESHLHPAGQAVVGKLCALAAENAVQIILETHSDHILNSIRVSGYQAGGKNILKCTLKPGTFASISTPMKPNKSSMSAISAPI